jgi:hypothetical protein
MNRIVLAAFLSLPAIALAQRAVNVDPAALDQARRDRSMQLQQDRDARIDRARQKCAANHGVDCDTMEGLQEWLLLDRSRAEAVLDRVDPLNASTGSSAVPGANVPDTSPRNSSAVPR